MIQIKINSTDRTSLIYTDSLTVEQQLTNLVDTCFFKLRKNTTFNPSYGDDIEVYDGTTQIFGGTILKVDESTLSAGEKGIVYQITAVDYTYEMDKKLVSKTYENETIKDIITDILSEYAPDFDADNVDSGFEIKKIVFNQIPTSQCIKKLAEAIRYDWYVDENKSVHFFEKSTNTAPFDLTDTDGNYIYKSLSRIIDGSQIVNTVKVRGGEYNGDTYTDSITVSGDASKSFKLPYKMANLTIEVNSVSQTVGVDFIDDFTSKDVLHNFQDQSFNFENPLNDGDVIEFSGNPKIRVFAISEDTVSKGKYGTIEKLIRDNSIKDNTVARRRANAELYAYAEELIEARFTTYTSGLRAGMKINIQSDNRDSNDDLIIKRLKFRARTPETFYYEADCITTKTVDLITMLAKILEPETLDIDEVEVSEQIFADTADISITADEGIIPPEEDFNDIEIQEDINLNPIDPEDIEWVYGYYFPTSDSDVKRMAKYDRDAKYQ
jgi:hypothetical protein